MAAIRKVLWTGRHKQQIFVVSELWRLQVQSQGVKGVNSVVPFDNCDLRSYYSSPTTPTNMQAVVSSLSHFKLTLSVSKCPLLISIQAILGWDLSKWPLFKLILSFKAPSPHKVTLWGNKSGTWDSLLQGCKACTWTHHFPSYRIQTIWS